MKYSFLSLAALMAAFAGVCVNPIDAGVSTISQETSCKLSSCTMNGCQCGPGCGCEPGSHDYFPYAPIGVMGDHIHHKGGLMASYRYMNMNMERNYDGDSQISDAQARDGYMASAADMQMEMHMMGLMYAPSDKLTLMLMSNYRENRMLNVNMMGQGTKMRSAGWGDTTLSAYYGLYKKPGSSAHCGLGLSAPTGSIDERMSDGARMGYPMQLGSGTWDLKPTITWLGQQGEWSYGSQASAVVHLGGNANGYSLGDSLSVTGWVSRRLSEGAALSLRLTGSDWGNVDGRDDEMPSIAMGPLAGKPMAGAVDPQSRGGCSLLCSIGLNLWDAKSGSRLAIEGGVPLYQNLDGPQLGAEWFLSAGFQIAW